MRPTLIALLTIAGSLSTLSGVESAAGTAATLHLSPASGPAPSVSGRLTGTGWCYNPLIPNPVAVAGAGVKGVAAVNASGALFGSFTAEGSAGQRRAVSVSALCRDGSRLTATAVFVFDAASPTPFPRATPAPATPTPATTPTPTPPPGRVATTTQASPTSTPAPTPPPSSQAQAAGLATLEVAGCSPREAVVELEPVRLPGARAISPAPAGAVRLTATSLPGQPGRLAFSAASVDPSLLYHMRVHFSTAECPDATFEGAWLPGSHSKVGVPFVGGKTDLFAFSPLSGLGPPAGTGEHPGSWVRELSEFGKPGGRKKFLYSTEVPGVTGGVWQASLWPFPTTIEADPLSPAALVASVEIDCSNCQFEVDLDVLSQVKGKEGQRGFWGGVRRVVTAPFRFAAKGASDAWDALRGLFVSGDSSRRTPVSRPSRTYLAETLAEAGAGQDFPPYPRTYYFRVVPTRGGAPVASPSTPVQVRYTGTEPSFDPRCLTVPLPPECLPPSGPAPYRTEILGYHGMVPPVEGHRGCYVVTTEATVESFLRLDLELQGGLVVYRPTGHVTYQPGALLCPPPPPEKDFLDALREAIEEGWDWVAAAYEELKGFAVDLVLDFSIVGLQCKFAEDAGLLPGGACEVAFRVALEAGLVALGLPPSVPNFSELREAGVEYLAVQIAAQVSIPPAVVETATREGGPHAGLSLALAEEALRREAEGQIAAGLREGVRQAELSYANSVPWIPRGVPVRPDPQGDWQTPVALVRLTCRLQAPAFCPPTTLTLFSLVTNDFEDPQSKAYIDFLKADVGKLEIGLKAGDGYRLYHDERVPIPRLEAGRTVLLPISLTPYRKWYGSPGLISVTWESRSWAALYWGGRARLSVTGPEVQAISIEVDAPGSFGSIAP